MPLHDFKTKPLLHLLSFCLAFLLLFTSLTAGYLPKLLFADEAESKRTDETEMSAKVTPITGSGWKEVQSSKGKVLAINLDTAEIKITDESTGLAWMSNPKDRDDDVLADGMNRHRLLSQVTASYNTRGGQGISKNSYFDAVRLGQFDLAEVGNEVRVNYVLGETPKEYLFPSAMKEKEYEDFYESLDNAAQRILRRRYTLYQADKLKAKDRELLETYPALADENLYILRDGIQEYILEDIDQIFLEAGFTAEDRDATLREIGIEITETETQNIELNLYYSLDKGDLVVRLPLNEIIYDRTAYPLTSLQILEMFGAAGDQDEGYLFVPDGSGALIYNNNEKLQANRYLAKVYGSDLAIQRELQVGIPEQITLPVFGIKRGETAFLSIIEEGSSMASIAADVAGRIHSYNTVSPIFTVLSRDEVSLIDVAGQNRIFAYQQEAYQGEYRLRYKFLTGEAASYSGMAEAYRNHLVEEGHLTPLEEKNYPLQLELIASIDKNLPVLGIPVRRTQVLTNFEEATELVQSLAEEGVEGFDVRYSSWTNHGFRQSLPKSNRPHRLLGSGDELKRFRNQLSSLGGVLYLDQDFSYVYRNSLLDSFIPAWHAARFLSREVASYRPISPATMIEDPALDPFWLLRPSLAWDLFAKWTNKIQKDYPGSGVALRHLGKDLSADYDRKEEMNREDVLVGWCNELAKHADRLKVQPLMAEYGNAYLLPYVDTLLATPSKSSAYQIMDEYVPFLQMVLHGYIDYSLEAINLAADPNAQILKSLEFGALPHFILMAEDGSILKDTQYSRYYSASADDWMTRIPMIYQELKEVLGPLRTQPILSHTKLAPEVTETVFQNGTAIYVNQGEEIYRTSDLILAGKSYHVKEAP